MKHKDCKGCHSFNHKDTIPWYQKCSLEPVFENEHCPCQTCLVKVTCEDDDSTCDIYYQFSKQQFHKIETIEEDVPCKTCNELLDCIERIGKLRTTQYGNPPEVNNEDEVYIFHSEILLLLEVSCEKIKEYFPFTVTGRDGGMTQSNNEHLKHWKASMKEMITEDEWYRRDAELYSFFYEYNVDYDTCNERIRDDKGGW